MSKQRKSTKRSKKQQPKQQRKGARARLTKRMQQGGFFFIPGPGSGLNAARKIVNAAREAGILNNMTAL
jgi:hypothetical protein